MDRFIHSDEARIAMRLLKASSQRIVFHKEKKGKSNISIKYLDGSGLRSSWKDGRCEGSREAHPFEVIHPHLMSNDQIHGLDGIVGWLRRKLDRIAEKAFKP